MRSRCSDRACSKTFQEVADDLTPLGDTIERSILRPSCVTRRL